MDLERLPPRNVLVHQEEGHGESTYLSCSATTNRPQIYVLESSADLLTHIPPESLLKEYGGELEYEIPDWYKFIEEQDAQRKSDSSSSSV